MGSKISIEEIPIERINEFWELHIKYLVDDGIISDEEDIAYFTGKEYRGILEDHMIRSTDKQHMVYFCRDGERIGAASYCTYQSEDGKCFILDYWVFPQFRGNGTGHRCFEALEQYTKADGAQYYELNSTKENSIRFWKSMGFVENGKDEYDMLLLVKR
ncbi:MAG: GNAT family N-acetyltransferase [Bacillota bacterium]|nr:GNAT family N-acetyltransferase [Bacillota bacterium]